MQCGILNVALSDCLWSFRMDVDVWATSFISHLKLLFDTFYGVSISSLQAAHAGTIYLTQQFLPKTPFQLIQLRVCKHPVIFLLSCAQDLLYCLDSFSNSKKAEMTTFVAFPPPHLVNYLQNLSCYCIFGPLIQRDWAIGHHLSHFLQESLTWKLFKISLIGMCVTCYMDVTVGHPLFFASTLSNIVTWQNQSFIRQLAKLIPALLKCV